MSPRAANHRESPEAGDLPWPSHERSRDRVDRPQPLTESGHRFTVSVQVTVCKVLHRQLPDATEGWSYQLPPDVVFPGVRRDEVQPSHGVPGARRQVEHTDDAGVNRCRVFDLESCGDIARRMLEPDHVDERNGIDSGQRIRVDRETAVAEPPTAERPRSVVLRHPNVKPERAPEIT